MAGTSPHKPASLLPAQRKDNRRCMRFVLALLACALSFALTNLPQVALAEDIDTNPAPDEFQQEVERTAAEYNDAVAQVERATAALDENRARIAELETAIPQQQARSGSAVREQYKLQQQSGGMLQLLLSSDSFRDFLANLEYITRISDANIAEMNRLDDMKNELDETQSALKLAKRDADTNAQRASEALAAAQEARAEAQRRAQEEARRQAEEAAAQAAAEQAAAEAAAAEQAAEAQKQAEQEAAAQKEAEKSSDGQSNTEESPATEEEQAPEATNVSAPSDDGADWSADQKAFVDEWSARIDAYLAGSPLAGQGTTFAVAAWNYGVDPRWSPAISCTESSKGAACFLPHNAWGWGSESYASWEEAIDSHVRGLARGYGYTISIEAAQKYCPPNAQHWYETTLAQMNLI